MSKKQFNENQLEAIGSRESEILVAAGAGSGKSTVLVERMLRRVADEQINIDEFFVVTFTNLAASELMAKIREELKIKLRENPADEHLRAQQFRLPLAYISTFHKFCNRILNRYGYLLGLDANMQLLEDLERDIMLSEAFEAFFDAAYEDEDFVWLSSLFGSDRSDDGLQVLMTEIYNVAVARPDMDEWLNDLHGFLQLEGETVASWPGYKDLKSIISLQLKTAIDLIEKGSAESLKSSLAPQYIEIWDSDLALIEELGENLADYDAARQLLVHFSRVAYPRKSKKWDEYDIEVHEVAKGYRDAAVQVVKKLEEDFFAYTNASHAIHFEHGRRVCELLGKFVGEFVAFFNARKLSASKMDFSDLEQLTLQLFESKPEVLSEVAAEFKEIMIDEYQDTNPMQERIVQLISEAGEVPVFMVGDMKQSIYRFRGADPSIFSSKYEAYKDAGRAGQNIHLMTNYRSRPEVLNGVNDLFERLMDGEHFEIEYDEDAKLAVGIEVALEEKFAPELHVIDKETVTTADEALAYAHDSELEARHVARLIAKMKAEDPDFNFSDVVILTRNMKSVGQVFHQILSDVGIPALIEQPGNLLEETEVLVALSALRVIDNPFQDIPLVAVMRSLFFFTEPELTRIRVNVKDISFYEAVKGFAKEKSEADSLLFEKVQHFIKTVDKWRYNARFQDASEVLASIYEDTYYLDYVLSLPGGKGRRANLELLEDVARHYEARAAAGWTGFLRHIDRLIALDKAIGKAKVTTANDEAVKIMSIHKSKGLEFPVVFVCGTQRRFNTQDEVGDYVLHKKLGLAPRYIDPKLRLKQKTLPMVLLAAEMRGEMLAEEMRLLYVALTRAKKKVILTGVAKNKETVLKISETDVKAAHVRLGARNYLDWVLPVVARMEAENPWRFEVVEEVEVLAQKVSGEVLPDLTGVDAATLEGLLVDDYPFTPLSTVVAKQSVSQRKVEETVPLFKGIPEEVPQVAYDSPSFIDAKVKATEVGTGLHQLMQHVPLKVGQTREALDVLVDSLVKRQVIKPTVAKQIKMDDVVRLMHSDLFAKVCAADEVLRELPFTMLIELEDVPGASPMLQGVIDMLAIFGDEVWIVDYKTDRVRNFEVEKPELRRRYDIQMKYYLQAMREAYPDKTVKAFVYFMTAGESVVYE